MKAIARAIPVTEMNRDEQRYADSLDLRKIAGEVSWWAFGSLRFRLADGAWYKPDFFVVLLDGSCVVVEVKGMEREAAIVRFKVAAELYPFFEWQMIRWKKGAWETLHQY